MKKTTYGCDLCNNEKDIEEVMSLRLIGTCPNHPETSRKTIELSDVKEDIETSNRHICFNCSDRIIEYRKKMATDD